ncbi:ATP-binding protein [Actinacidiphila oryziradicis]|nr:ATP-binding protein [Actinacidiphila oryziradicis]
MIGEQFTARPPEPRVHPLSNAQCRLALRLAPERSEVRRARHAVEKALMAWGLRRVVFEAVLLSSELVTNAVEHAPHGDIELSLCHDDGIVYIEVEDGSASPPALQRPDNDAEHGRGLELVGTWPPPGVGASAKPNPKSSGAPSRCRLRAADRLHGTPFPPRWQPWRGRCAPPCPPEANVPWLPYPAGTGLPLEAGPVPVRPRSGTRPRTPGRGQAPWISLWDIHGYSLLCDARSSCLSARARLLCRRRG